MDRQLVREQMSSARGLDRGNIADDVRDGHVGRRQFFNVPRVTINPVNRRIIAFFGDDLFAIGADRVERIVVNLRPGDNRYEIVEQVGQFPQDAALRLAAQSEQDDVVLSQQRVDDLRNDGVFVTDYPVDNFPFVTLARENVTASTNL